ncbi:MAG: DUF1549 and DUF1553 domain-containing protein [Pirellulales bacterium]
MHRSLLTAGLRACLALFVLLASRPLARGSDEPPAPSFTAEVMAVLSKAGCNAGTCHGNQNGKGGLKLSLRGQDPDLDFLALSRDQFGRRTNTLDPEQSLVLLKPSMQLAHEGGLRLKRESLEYEILRRWIAAGMPVERSDAPRLMRIEVQPAEQVLFEPNAEVQFAVEATFNDGTRRDVTRLAVYEPSASIVAASPDGRVHFAEFGEATIIVRYLNRQVPVRLAYVPARPDFVWNNPPTANYIDEHIFAKLRSLRMNPAAVAGDSEFIRRAYLDALGVLPTADEAREFVADQSPGKRLRLIDRLLGRPEFADHWALKWSDLLKNEEKVVDPKGVKLFHEWIRDSFAENKPLDRFVRELIAARGSTYENPPANYYRANRDAVTRAESTAQLFLGVRLGCAKCHNHPFDRWTQEDYYRWAALFARVDYKIVENNRPDDNDKHQFDGEQIVLMSDKGEVEDPRTKETLAPRFLGEPELLAGDDAQDRLLPLAAWLASPDNELFVRSQANRIWYHLMGRGLVEPIDDFRATNPAVNPELLDALSDDFVRSGFDVRHLVRVIMTSRTYQLSAEPNETNRTDEVNFSRAIVKRLPAEELLDALTAVIGGEHKLYDSEPGTRAGQAAGVGGFERREKGQGNNRQRRRAAPSDAEKFLKLFGKPPRLLTCECERATDATLAQAFQLLSGPTIHRMLMDEDNRLAKLLASSESAGEMIDDLYWGALSRAPSDDEREALVRHMEQSEDWRMALEDIAWGVVNSKEFLLRR